MFGLLGLLVVFGTVALFYKGGEFEDSNTFGGHRAAVWAGASVALWAAAIFLLHWGVLGGLALQVGLFVFLTAWGMARMARAERKGARGDGAGKGTS
jgi:hypothetical protein